MKTSKDTLYKKSFIYDDSKDEYSFTVKRKRNWWWLLLFLLPILLFIKCERDIEVCVTVDEGDSAIENASVDLAYTSHFLYHEGHLFYNEDILRSGVTGTDGKVLFTDLKCSIYSYIFYCLSKVQCTVWGNCFDNFETKRIFHSTRRINVDLTAKAADFIILVKDKDTGIEIPGSKVEYVIGGHIAKFDSCKTDAKGEILVRKVWECGYVKSLRASAYGYNDMAVDNISIEDILDDGGKLVIELIPVKEQFNFQVKNKFTHQPIPGARATVTLTSSNNERIIGTSITNVDGMGRGFYDNAFILSKVRIKAEKLHFKSGKLTGEYTVEEFNKLPDSLRVVYLEPEPFVQDFQNVDSVTGRPIIGVLNHITVESQNGNINIYQEISNSMGYFPVKAMEGDVIIVTSILPPAYKDKYTRIQKFEKNEVVYMVPEVTDIAFRTVDATTGTLLGDCGLEIYLNSELLSTPVNSGNGEFIVKDLFIGGTVTIIASKQGYRTNNYTINEKQVVKLIRVQQRELDIPLDLDLPPCQGGTVKKDTNGVGDKIDSYTLGRKGPGRFLFEYNTDSSLSDRFIIYNCRKEEIASHAPIYDTGDVCTEGRFVSVMIDFIDPVITVHAITSGDGSYWEYIVNCPE